MLVAGHPFRMDGHAVFFGGPNDQFPKPFVNRRNQDLPTTPRTPREMVFQAENRPGIGSRHPSAS
jgi:hypothetical protein